MSKLCRGNRGFRRCVPGTRRAAWALGLMLCAIGAPALAASGKCKLGKMVEFQVTMDQQAPEIAAKINGTDVKLIIDSGAFFSSLDPGSASSLGLRLHPAPVGFYEIGVGGRVSPSLTNVDDFTVPGLTLHNLEFIVGGSHVGGGQVVGLLGRNILQVGDAEYDFAAGAARIMKAQDCGDTVLAYWLRAGESYSVVDTVRAERSFIIGSHIQSKETFRPPVVAVAYVNGTPIRAMFDSGASTSFLKLKAAEKAGIKIDSPGVIPGGVSFGLGRSTVQTYLAPVSIFKIGDEEIHNTRLRLGDTELPGVDMLIGADFFLSHHIYVANSQDKLYFSYNGGPVFNLTAQHSTASAPSAAAPSAQAPATPASSADAKEPASDSTAPTAAAKPAEAAAPAGDASEYARRGAALRARQELDQALQAYDRACELAPNNADYFYQRALLHMQLRQSGPALADLDRTIQLDPRHVAALLMRAGDRTRSGDKAGAESDLDTVNAVLPKEDNERLTLASDYLNLDLFQPAVEQYDLWIVSHQQDVRLPVAFAGRCRARAIGNMDLQSAKKDCDMALKHVVKASPFYSEVSATRGLLLFRLGDYDKSIEDYDTALKINPKNAFALYGRGIDKVRKQKTQEGQADIAQATALSPKIAQGFDQHGIDP
jgi:tetratricopeptide (TPR) repeat protein/predicted aspartyl protease